MFISLKVNNAFVFNKEVEFTMKANMQIKKFSTNTINIDEKINILKTAVIYGPNNTGKSCFINIIRSIKNTLSNYSNSIFGNSKLESNLFEENNLSEISFRFSLDKNIYNYEYKYDSLSKTYPYEKLIEIDYDKWGNEKEFNIFVKDAINNFYDCEDKELISILPMASKDNILIYTLDIEKFSILSKIKNILTAIADKMIILDMNNIQEMNTIRLLKDKDAKSKKVVEFIKMADIYLDDVYYDDSNDDLEDSDKDNLPFRSFTQRKKLMTVYHNKALESIKHDSTGTRKIIALSSYIITALEEEKILFIDEIDSSLHFKLTRAIISLFNNDINNKSQLIATTHDVSLLDIKHLFRKEQIWFTDKNDIETKLYSLSNFTANNDNIRDNTDLYDKYSKGYFDSIPEPELLDVFEDE